MTGSPHTEGSTDLYAARAPGHHLVHLAPHESSDLLCGRTRDSEPPRTSFRSAPCPACLIAAREAADLYAWDGRAYISLFPLQSGPVD